MRSLSLPSPRCCLKYKIKNHLSIYKAVVVASRVQRGVYALWEFNWLNWQRPLFREFWPF